MDATGPPRRLEIAALSSHYTPVRTDVWTLAGLAADGEADAAQVAIIIDAICP